MLLKVLRAINQNEEDKFKNIVAVYHDLRMSLYGEGSVQWPCNSMTVCKVRELLGQEMEQDNKEELNEERDHIGDDDYLIQTRRKGIMEKIAAKESKEGEGWNTGSTKC